jgi:catechol 2,3-dioxygenase
MPLKPPVYDPPFNVLRSSHVALGVADLAASRAFYVDCLGLIVTEESKDRLYLRGTEERNHHSIELRQTGDPLCYALGLKVASEKDLDLAKAWFEKRGLPAEFRETPYAKRTLFARDVRGMPLEFYSKMTTVESALQKYGLHRGARISRIDHLNCFTDDVQSSYEFYNDLGFRLTEYADAVDDGPAQFWAVWMHRKGNVHDMAFTNGLGPRLHHIGVWAPTAVDILNLCDVMSTTGYIKNMERGPGRHGISNAFFLYIRDPDGHRIELFASDYLTVDHDHEPIRWSLRDPQRQTLWGHPAPKSWFEEGTVFEGCAVRPPVLEAQPIVAR